MTIVREVNSTLSWKGILGRQAEPDPTNRNYFLGSGGPFNRAVKGEYAWSRFVFKGQYPAASMVAALMGLYKRDSHVEIGVGRETGSPWNLFQ